MKFYPEDYNVELVVGFTDLNDQPVEVSAVSAVLYDGEDQEIVDFGSLPLDQGATEKSIMIPAAFNVLEDGEIRAPRILRIELTTAAGAIRRSFSYVIEAEQRLVIMTNTFVSFEAAEMLALDAPNTSGWSVASEDQKKAALIEAYRRVTSIPMRFSLEDYDYRTGYDRLVSEERETVILRHQWDDVTADDYAGWPKHFRKALRRAQFIEANELLQGDNVGKKHRAGIVTETIGESSVTLRAGRVDYGVASQTLAALTGYLYFNMRIARA